jgi:hypothetical protein
MKLPREWFLASELTLPKYQLGSGIAKNPNAKAQHFFKAPKIA